MTEHASSETGIAAFAETNRLTLVHAAGIALACGAFWLHAGLFGIVLALGLGAGLFVLPEVVVFALGHLVIAAIVEAQASLAMVLVAELPLLLFLASPFVDVGTTWREDVVSLALGGVVVTASVGLAVSQRRLWVAALVVSAIVGAGIYGLHRYALVTFNLVDHE
jgi:hypothetical protein